MNYGQGALGSLTYLAGIAFFRGSRQSKVNRNSFLQHCDQSALQAALASSASSLAADAASTIPDYTNTSTRTKPCVCVVVETPWSTQFFRETTLTSDTTSQDCLTSPIRYCALVESMHRPNRLKNKEILSRFEIRSYQRFIVTASREFSYRSWPLVLSLRFYHSGVGVLYFTNNLSA
jgi:hypothetical protein